MGAEIRPEQFEGFITDFGLTFGTFERFSSPASKDIWFTGQTRQYLGKVLNLRDGKSLEGAEAERAEALWTSFAHFRSIDGPHRKQAEAFLLAHPQTPEIAMYIRYRSRLLEIEAHEMNALMHSVLEETSKLTRRH